MDDQEGVNFNENREDRAKYANSFGNRLNTTESTISKELKRNNYSQKGNYKYIF
jgi:IS30 family transposase